MLRAIRHFLQSSLNPYGSNVYYEIHGSTFIFFTIYKLTQTLFMFLTKAYQYIMLLYRKEKKIEYCDEKKK